MIRVLQLCTAVMLALAINAHAQTPAQAKAVRESCNQWFLPLDKFTVISDDNYDEAIKAWLQVSSLMSQRIDSLAATTGLSFHETIKLVEAQYMNHPFMAKKAAYERLRDKEWRENRNTDLAIIESYMKGATIEAREAMVAEISFAASDKNDVMYMVSEYYAPIHRAYDELLAKGLEKKLLDNSRRQCLHELDSVALRTALSADVEKRIDDIVGQRLQSVAAEVAHITTFDELEKYSQCFSQIMNEIVKTESAGHSSVWRNKLERALSRQGYDLLQARHEALWDDLIGRISVVARPIVQSYARAVSNARDHDEYCKIYYDFSKKIDKGGELYMLLLKNGFSKEDIQRYRHEYIKELEQY